MSKPVVYHLQIYNSEQGRDRDENYYEEDLWLIMHYLTRFISNLSEKMYHPWHSMKYIQDQASNHGVNFTIKKIYTDRWKINVSDVTWDWDKQADYPQESEKGEKETE